MKRSVSYDGKRWRGACVEIFCRLDFLFLLYQDKRKTHSFYQINTQFLPIFNRIQLKNNSTKTNTANTTLAIPLVVKNAMFTLLRSLGLTRVC